MEKDSESEAGSIKNLMRNVQAIWPALLARVKIPAQACTLPVVGRLQRLLHVMRRENIEQDEQSLNEYVKVCLEKLLKGLHDMRKEIDTFKRDIQRAVNFQGEEIKELEKDTELLKTVTKNTSSENRLTRQYAEKIHAEVNNLERYSRRNNIRLVG